jgi:ribosomal protein S18 acetylase RimI-like enzyme
MMSEAIAGRSPGDGGRWAELDTLAIDVLCDGHGGICGIVSYAHRARDGAGLVLWLHGREQPAVVEALLDHADRHLPDALSVEAFEFASALTVGLEGLPKRHRPVTRQALLTRGFVEADLWRYMRRDLPAADLPRVHETCVLPAAERPGWRVVVRGPDGTLLGGAQAGMAAPGLGAADLPRVHETCVLPAAERPGWRVVVRGPDGTLLGGAHTGIAAPRLGVLWWIGVEEPYRGQRLGWSLLASALEVLHEHGAREAILFVDDDAPPDDPRWGRGAANALYDRAGFAEIDRLCSYRRR